MKIFQISANICHWDATTRFPTVDSTKGFFPPDVLFVEAPDYVFEGWGYVNGEFIEPTPPEGWLYDRNTGTFYQEGFESPKTPIPTNEQLKAVSDRQDFLEDCIAEMAGQVYG